MSQYTCEKCGGVFDKTWPDEEAIAERKRDFPDTPDDQFAIICEDCYQAFSEWRAAGYPPQGDVP